MGLIDDNQSILPHAEFGPNCSGQITIRTFLKPLSDLEILLVKIKSENEKLVELGKKKNEENGWNYKTVDNTGLI